MSSSNVTTHNYKNIPDLTDKVAIVSGANSGTGYGITYHLVKHKCKVIMAARSQERLQKARADLLKEVPDAKEDDLEIELLDICSMQSIRDFCARVSAKYSKIDFLANNAGGGAAAYTQTVDGFESNFFLNYLGHFALTTLLLPLLKDNSRIVNFSSIGYKRFLKNDLDTDHLECTDAAKYDQMEEYCRGKLCCILHSVRLSQEFAKVKSSSLALACHPGNARTNLLNADDQAWYVKYFLRFLLPPIFQLFGVSHSLYDGALPAIEALVSDDAKPGVCYAPGHSNEMTGDPIAWEIDHTHYKDEDIDKLWEKSQEMLNLKVSDYLK